MVDRSEIGRTLPPVTASVEPGRLRFFLKAIGETNPVYSDAGAARAAGFREAPIPPTYLFCLEMMDAPRPFVLLEELGIDIGRVLHGDQSFVYRAPVYPGDVVTFRSRITDVLDKKAGALTFVVLDTEADNQRGERVADIRRTVVIRNPGPGA